MAALSLVRLDAPAGRMRSLEDFYGGRLELPLERGGGLLRMRVGESAVELTASDGAPFYHVALLVPGNRFDAALAWARERVELLPEQESGDPVFDFANWDALACYFHDPAGSIVELIAHRGVGETGEAGAFGGRELLGLAEVGIVCDPPSAAAALERELGSTLWDGTVDGGVRLAFVGEKARTLILCRPGRPWLPTGRPAEAWPVEVDLDPRSGPPGEVRLPGGSVVRRAASGRSVRAS